MRTFESILVANRGEIAVRVIRTARSLGYRTIAIHSEADSLSPHVQLADDAILIGPAPVGQSYLDIGKVIDAAKRTSAEAVHPGYGFLAENADFARACEEAGLVFIGPGADAIDLMGNKARAKRRMQEAGVACVPGYEGEDQSDAALTAAAREIGFPLMVKAAAGGGGRGMRLVETEKALASALGSARSEALNAFGSDELILEKAILRPRHVEVQVFADTHGNVIHLGERDCSVQRRHQKVVEEAPCPVMTADLRARMGGAAVEAARSIGYRNAGTVEFLLDEDENFYFLEMNTRLQVEHPVTEMITGLDLVAMQIHVAEGRPFDISQEDVRLDGHAIEVRLYAEDPAQEFLPATGRIDLWRPVIAEGVRMDSGVETGGEVSPFYDPMIAKVIAWGETRETARHRLINALKGTALFGLTTNRSFLIDVLSREVFARGQATTAFLAEEFGEADLARPEPTLRQCAIAAVIQFLVERKRSFDSALNVSAALLDWSNANTLTSRYSYRAGDEDVDLSVRPESRGHYRVSHGEENVQVELIDFEDNVARLTVDGRREFVLFSAHEPGRIELSLDGAPLTLVNRFAALESAEAAEATGHIVAPMHGALVEVFVKPGEDVEAGARLAVLEAMKMQHDILAGVSGTVSEIFIEPGAQVSAGEPLIVIETGD